MYSFQTSRILIGFQPSTADKMGTTFNPKLKLVGVGVPQRNIYPRPCQLQIQSAKMLLQQRVVLTNRWWCQSGGISMSLQTDECNINREIYIYISLYIYIHISLSVLVCLIMSHTFARIPRNKKTCVHLIYSQKNDV